VTGEYGGAMNFFEPTPAAMPTIGVLILLYVAWGTNFFPLVLVGFVICLLASILGIRLALKVDPAEALASSG